MGKLRDRRSNGWIFRNPGNLDPIPPKCLFLAVLKLARGWRRITLELYEIKLYELFSPLCIRAQNPTTVITPLI